MGTDDQTATATAMPDGAPKPRGEAVYVVQVWTNADVDNVHREWVDAVEVTVPAKTKRKTVVEKAVEQDPSIAASGGGLGFVRVIPAEHAEPIKVEMEQPPPQLRIG